MSAEVWAEPPRQHVPGGETPRWAPHTPRQGTTPEKLLSRSRTPLSFQLKELKMKRKAGKCKNGETRIFSLQPALTDGRVFITWHQKCDPIYWKWGVGTFIKTITSFLRLFSALSLSFVFVWQPFIPVLPRLLVSGRPVPRVGETLRGRCWQALGEAARPRYHRRLQGTETRQLPSRLAHTVQRKGYGTASHSEMLACTAHALKIWGYGEIVSFLSPASKAATPETFPCSPGDGKRSARNSCSRALCPLVNEPFPV